MKLLCLLLLLVGPLLAAESYQGYILSVQKYYLATKPVPYLLFILNVKGEEYRVDAGPEWFILDQGVLLTPRAEIEVWGTATLSGDQKRVTAHEIRQGDTKLLLRSRDGSPLWDSCFGN